MIEDWSGLPVEEKLKPIAQKSCLAGPGVKESTLCISKFINSPNSTIQEISAG